MSELPDKCSECGAPVRCVHHEFIEGVVRNEWNWHRVLRAPRVTRTHEAPLYFVEPMADSGPAGFCGATCAAKWLGRKVYASSDCALSA